MIIIKTLTYFLKIILINTPLLEILWWCFWGKSCCTKWKTQRFNILQSKLLRSSADTSGRCQFCKEFRSFC